MVAPYQVPRSDKIAAEIFFEDRRHLPDQNTLTLAKDSSARIRAF